MVKDNERDDQCSRAKSPRGPDPARLPPGDIATRIMAQMVRMPPKPHEKMKIGKSAQRRQPK